MRGRLSIISCLAGFLFFGGTLLASEPYMFRSIEVEDGLSQNMVYCVYQDDLGFMWFGTQSGLNRYDGSSFRIFDATSSSLQNDVILAIAGAPDGRLWTGTVNGLYVFDPRYETFSQVELKNSDSRQVDGLVRSISFDRAGSAYVTVADTCVFRISNRREAQILSFPGLPVDTHFIGSCFDDEGNIWFATFGAGLVCRHPGGDFEVFPSGGPDGDLFNTVTLMDSETLVVGTRNRGALLFNLRTHTYSPIAGLDTTQGSFVHDILCDSEGRIWAGTENGIFIWNGGEVTHLEHIPNNPYSLSDNAVFSIFEDRDGGVWASTYFGGVNYYSKYTSQFHKFFPSPGYNQLKGKNISEFLELPDGTVCIGTEDAGLHFFNPATSEFRTDILPCSNVHALYYTDGRVLVGTYGDGLYVLNPSTGSYYRLKASDFGGSLRDDSIYAIYKDVYGVIWLGTDSGLCTLDLKARRISIYPGLEIESHVNAIHQDFYGNIWVGTEGSGIFRLDVKTGRWRHLEAAPKYVSCLLEDNHHDLWVGTEDGGFLRYNHANGYFSKPITIEDGLPDNMVYMLLQDGSGYIWGSTNHGLFRYDPVSSQILAFDHNSGLVCDQFNFKSAMKSTAGDFYFGGVKGFVRFSPDDIVLPESSSKLVFNRLLIYNQEVRIGADRSPLNCAMPYAERVVLRPDQSVFSIGFADLDYSFSNVRGYSYRISGDDADWIELEHAGQLTFSNLRPGHHTLEVRAQGNPAPCSIDVVVLPPWYRTVWAYVLYALLVVGLVVFVYRYSVDKTRRRGQAMISEMERRKEKELYDSKIGFFTHITHEIRTPLTLITAPLEEVLDKTPEDSPVYEDLAIVKRNSSRLLTLVNELLDFRKVGVETMLPNFIHSDVVAVTAQAMTNFKAVVEAGGLSVTTDFPATLEADVDREIYLKIFNNLFGNACKHAGSRIGVSLSCPDEQHFRLAISNDGDSIPPTEAEHIFAPFVKLDENIPGSGIGLPFARNLATTHGGTLFLDTDVSDVCFVLELPLEQENALAFPQGDTVPSEVLLPEDDSASNPAHATVLVVDDNEDFRIFLGRKLSQKYRVLLSENGIAAKRLMAEESVDLVITDCMMPGMDGLTLCASIREDIGTSHIPVILISAKSDAATRMEAASQGADDFIAKPFQTSYLMVKVENILRSRENLRKAFHRDPDLAPSSIATNTRDVEFLDRVTEIIEAGMDNPEMSVDDIAAAVNMSRATFYRKMKGVTEYSPNDFIRLCRLKKAASLIAAGSLPVGEIAYLVGFSSLSYFSHCFSKQFGIAPKDYKG